LGKAFDEHKTNSLIEMKNDEFSSNIKEKFKEKRNEREKLLGKEHAEEIEKRIFLQIIDASWKSHIQYLEQLRGVIGLRSYGQRDPLIEYKKEAFLLFENLLNKLKTDLVTILLNLKIVEQQQEQIKSSEAISSNPKCLLNINKGKKTSRNERCPATGKKFKQCCGALQL
jgi:preprotein translocase subunit SecA